VATSLGFSLVVTVAGLAVALLLASLANARIRGLAVYRTLLLWPYGIAPAVAGVIWLFVFHPSFGVLPYLLSFVTDYQFNWFLKGWVALTLIVIAAVWKQFGYNLASTWPASRPSPARCSRRPASTAPVPSDDSSRSRSPPVAGHLLPVHAQHDLRVLRDVRPHPRGDAGGPGDATSILVYRAWKDGFDGLQLGYSAAQSVILMLLVIALTAVQFRYAEKKGHVLMDRSSAITPRSFSSPRSSFSRSRSTYAFVISTQSLDEVTSLPPKLAPSTHLVQNYADAWSRVGMGRLLLNSAIVALAVALGKIVISLLSAFAIVYFDFRGKRLVFWMIFVTLMLPVPVRIVSTYQVVSVLGWVDTYWGLTVPLMARPPGPSSSGSTTGPSRFARRGGAARRRGPLRFCGRYSCRGCRRRTSRASDSLRLGWNDYLWPLMVTNSQGDADGRDRDRLLDSADLAAAGMERRDGRRDDGLLPPVRLQRRWFVKGLIETGSDADRGAPRRLRPLAGDNSLGRPERVAFGSDLLELGAPEPRRRRRRDSRRDPEHDRRNSAVAAMTRPICGAFGSAS